MKQGIKLQNWTLVQLFLRMREFFLFVKIMGSGLSLAGGVM